MRTWVETVESVTTIGGGTLCSAVQILGFALSRCELSFFLVTRTNNTALGFSKNKIVMTYVKALSRALPRCYSKYLVCVSHHCCSGSFVIRSTTMWASLSEDGLSLRVSVSLWGEEMSIIFPIGG